MFKKKSFVVKMVDDKQLESTETDSPPSNSPESIAIEVVTGAAGAVTAGFILCKVVSTMCDIALHTAQVKIK